MANLIVDFFVNSERLSRLAIPYLTDEKGKADITVTLSKSDDYIKRLQQRSINMTVDELLFFAAGSIFHRKLLMFGGLMLHSSALSQNGRAYLFSANSGVGKSTHVSLWQQCFDDVVVLNDDKPVIRKIDGKLICFGTPFSGKTDLNTNSSAPLKAIVFLERSETNFIEKLPKEKVAMQFIQQTVRSNQKILSEKMLLLADDIIKNTACFKLHCNISEQAVQAAYNELCKID